MRECARLLDDLRDTGRVVDSAVIDAIAGRIRLADAEMIPVRRVDDVFVLEGGVAAFEPGEDVA